ncbi:MAG: YciI family protein [Blastocatellia bacterium]|nr:YciI family protein [Blastocatellia bacterium]
MRFKLVFGFLCFLLMVVPVAAQENKSASVPDPALARQLGADERGMRKYILVILKTGPQRVPDGPARTDMFKGHFANIQRLAKAGKLVVAGPFGDKSDWRGMFVFAVDTREEAEKLVATDPVIQSGEMVAEYHQLYASAALMAVNGIHEKIAPAPK